MEQCEDRKKLNLSFPKAHTVFLNEILLKLDDVKQNASNAKRNRKILQTEKVKVAVIILSNSLNLIDILITEYLCVY